MSEVFIKAAQQDRCSDTVYYTSGTLQQDLFRNRRTKGIKQLNADLNNPIYPVLKTLAAPSGGLIPVRLPKLPFVWKAPRCRASTAGAKAAGCGSAQETIGGAATAAAALSPKNQTKSRAKPLAACPTALRCHQLVLGGSKGRMELGAPVQSLAAGAGRGGAQRSSPGERISCRAGLSRAASPAPPANCSRELSLKPRRSFRIHRLFCCSVVKPSLLIRVLGKRLRIPAARGEKWTGSPGGTAGAGTSG